MPLTRNLAIAPLALLLTVAPFVGAAPLPPSLGVGFGDAASNLCLDAPQRLAELLCAPFEAPSACSTLSVVWHSVGAFPAPGTIGFASHAWAAADTGRPVDTAWDSAAIAGVALGPFPAAIVAAAQVDCYAEFKDGAGFAYGTARVGALMIGLPVGVLEIRDLQGATGLDSQCSAASATQEGFVANVWLNGASLTTGDEIPANTRLVLPGVGHLTLNEQTALGVDAAGRCSAHTTALHLHLEAPDVHETELYVGWAHMAVPASA